MKRFNYILESLCFVTYLQFRIVRIRGIKVAFRFKYKQLDNLKIKVGLVKQIVHIQVFFALVHLSDLLKQPKDAEMTNMIQMILTTLY